MTVRRFTSASIAIATLLASLGATTSARAEVPDPSLIPPHGAWFGSWVKPETGWMRADTEAAVTGLERDLGVKLGIDHHFFPWGKTIPGWQADWDVANGRIPMTTWGEADVAEVNAGVHDAYIRGRAAAFKAVDAPIFLRWFGEMEADGKAALARSPGEFIAAWRRMHGLFASAGATNVRWVWCPTAYGFATGEAATFYPGDQYVDWLCADGYNWAPGNPTAAWRSFEQVFSPFHAWGLARGKPMMVGETGVQERSEGEKAAWIAQAGTALKTTLTGIRALVYFSAVAPDFQGRMYDFRYSTSPSSVTAFSELSVDPFFQPLEPQDEPPPPPSPDPSPEPTDPSPEPTDPSPEPTDPSPDPAQDQTDDGEPGVSLEPEPAGNGSGKVKVRPRRPKRLGIVVANDGPVDDTFRLTGARSSRRLRVRLLLDGRDVTSKVLHRGLSIPDLAPGTEVGMTMIVRGRSKARGRSRQTVQLAVASMRDPSIGDDFHAVIRMRR